MAASLSLLPVDKLALQNACQRMRVLIRSCPGVQTETMHATFNALGALEQIALNAPENTGRIRTLQYELRAAIRVFSKASTSISADIHLQAALGEILDIMRKSRGLAMGTPAVQW